MGRRSRVPAVRALAAAVAAATAVAATTLAAGAVPAVPEVRDGHRAPSPEALYLVTLRTPGTATPVDGSALPRPIRALRAVAEQDVVLSSVGSPTPVYRWTTAVNGFAVKLDPAQADRLEALPQVVDVERDTVRPLAGLTGAAGSARPGDAPGDPALAALATLAGPKRGGRGVVVGVVDTGVAPESPVFALRSSGGRPPGFAGACETPEGDPVCSGKVVAARSYVAGFGRESLRAATTVSPRDTDGHGTRTAAIAAGNARVRVVLDGERLGRFGGQAPDAALAIYKACWTAPDPRDDGCSVADLVAAVDDATREGVDVLTVAVGGPAGVDVLERALLGATEAGVVVVAASGNDGAGAPAHTSPWVTTVGAVRGDARRGRVVLPGGRRLAGAMASRRPVPPTRVVRAADAAADGVRRRDARLCAPDSLDAAAVAGAVVVCDRGQVGRVDKSRTVALADGAAMVLVNRGRGSVDADVHSVPTVHLPVGPARRLLRWLERAPRPRLALRPAGVAEPRTRVAPFSGSGDAGTGALKPDLVAAGTDVLAPAPGELGGWGVADGTSAATARVAGVAAALLGRGMSPAEVRSALVTSARPLRREAVVRAGAGLLRGRDARRPGLALVVDETAYRRWLDGARTRLNTPSVLLTGGQRATRRRVTNVTGRRQTFSVRPVGFRREVRVTPSTVRLRPGESARFRLRVGRAGADRLDDGYVVWRGPRTVTRLPVVVAR